MLSFKQFQEAVINVDFKNKRTLGDLKPAPPGHVEDWMDKHISSDDSVTTPRTKAYDHYRTWSHNNGHEPISSEEFHSTVKNRFTYHRFAGTDRYNALKINESKEENDIKPTKTPKKSWKEIAHNNRGHILSTIIGGTVSAATGEPGYAIWSPVAGEAINRITQLGKNNPRNKNKTIKESEHIPIHFYDDNAPPPDDKISVTPEKVHRWVRKHQANMYTIQHIQKNLGDNQPNAKIHYTNQLEIARRKRDYWINKPIPGTGGAAHYYDRSKAKQDIHHARNISYLKLQDLGYNNMEKPPQMPTDPKVAALPRTADGRIRFGVIPKK